MPQRHGRLLCAGSAWDLLLRTMIHHNRGERRRGMTSEALPDWMLSRSVLGPGHRRISDWDRFWSHVDKSGECWLWTATTTRLGYGNFSVGGRTKTAHRVLYQWLHGSLTRDVVVDHICHNRSCVRPEHLRSCTRKQNIENHQGAQRNSRSGVRGVTQLKNGKWRAELDHHGKRYYLGTFAELEEANQAVTSRRNELFTHNNIDRMSHV